MVLTDFPHNVLAWSTYSSPPKGYDVSRACSMAETVMTKIEDWITFYKIKDLGIALEMPIWRQNAKSFSKQWRLIQELEAAILFRSGAYDLARCMLVEISPTASKKLSTGKGNASKMEVVDASPFWGHPEDRSSEEAVADAWSHSLAVWNPAVGVRIDVSKLTAMSIHCITSGGKP